ncbi:hypothetical protein [Streptomyces sp. NPDC048638]|uniref:hypothetical protein n=1 Tax=Streptomyces sp. NPDC048638 TaxID=3365580 RepID=UPI00371FFD81
MDVVVDLAEHFGQIRMATKLGLHDGLTADQAKAAMQRVEEDDETQLAVLSIETLREWSKSAQGDAVNRLCLAVVGYLAKVCKASEDEIPEMLDTRSARAPWPGDPLRSRGHAPTSYLTAPSRTEVREPVISMVQRFSPAATAARRRAGC